MNSIFEQQRQLHTDLELLVRASTQLLLQKSKKESILTDSLVGDYLSLHQHKSKQLLQLYESTTELEQERSKITTTDKTLPEFYALLKQIKTSYAARQDGHEFVTASDLELLKIDWDAQEDALEAKFSGEEGLGRFLDLIPSYNAYLNLKNVKRLSYIAYLQVFFDFGRVPRESKGSLEYKRYGSHRS